MTLPLVLLHGLNNSPAVFARVRAELDPEWPIIAPTLPIAEDVDAVAAALLPILPDRFLLCGFSFGGYVATALLAAVPERIAGLALIGSGPPRTRRQAARRARRQSLGPRQAAMSASPPRARRRRCIPIISATRQSTPRARR